VSIPMKTPEQALSVPDKYGTRKSKKDGKTNDSRRSIHIPR